MSRLAVGPFDEVGALCPHGGSHEAREGDHGNSKNLLAGQTSLLAIRHESLLRLVGRQGKYRRDLSWAASEPSAPLAVRLTTRNAVH